MDTIELILNLIKKNKLTQKELADIIGISQGNLTDWKNKRSKPSAKVLQKIATYFNVSVDYLLTGKETDYNEELGLDNETIEYLEELKNRPELKMLFSVSKGATKADIEKAVKIIEALRGME